MTEEKMVVCLMTAIILANKPVPVESLNRYVGDAVKVADNILAEVNNMYTG